MGVKPNDIRRSFILGSSLASDGITEIHLSSFRSQASFLQHKQLKLTLTHNRDTAMTPTKQAFNRSFYFD